MPHADFVHLRVRTAYSLSEGAIPIKKLAALCKEQGFPAVAMTDSANLFGAIEFSQACSAAGVQPIIGCRLPVARGEGEPAANGHGRTADDLVVLVRNAEGYANLTKLVSKAFLESADPHDPQLALDDFRGRSAGLIALTGGPGGGVGRFLAAGQSERAESLLQTLRELFPGSLYVELMRHGLPVEDRIEPQLIDLAYRLDLPLVATNDVYFPDAEMYEAHDALLCIAAGTTVSRQDRPRVTPEHRFKSAGEMRALFADIPEAVDNTLVVARRCAFLVEKRKPLLPKAFADRDEAAALREDAAAGLEGRLEQVVYEGPMSLEERERVAAPYRERLAYELEVIIQMGFAGYFLIVAEFIQWARSQGIPVGPGRGSGAGSVVAWALTITDLDPLRFGLLFERFLNPERVSMPDFDIDFCQDRRDEVIEHVRDHYGADRVAQIITFGKLQARAALRDVGRVLEMPYGQVDRLCKMVPYNPANPVTLADAIAGEPRLAHERDSDPTVARLLKIALQLEGLYRHASTHAAGVVIGDRPLDELLPLYRDPRSDMPVTQFNMKYVEDTGLVKFDFLGLKTLTVLQRAKELVDARYPDRTLDLAALPLDDAATFEMLCRADTTGVFQLESAGMRDTLRKLRPDRIEDIIAVVALYRPGPMDNIGSYIARKHGQELPDYLHPSLESILSETYGIMIYQEQVMQIAQTLAGYSLGSADMLRRAMGKKIQSEMDAQRSSFVEGAIARGVDSGKASTIFDLVSKFAGYGFNKSHAAAYAMVAYQTAYLKANHPVEFFAASMSLDRGNTDKLSAFKQELDRQGISLLPPDINRSEVDFSVDKDDEGRDAVRYALSAIRNVGEKAMEAVVAERNANGPFKDLFDFAERLDPRTINKRMIENLARAGAFDALNPNRAQVLAAAEIMLRYANRSADERAANQQTLFGTAADEAMSRPPLPIVAEWPMIERLNNELEALGFYLSAHPLDAYGTSLRRLGVIPYANLVRERPQVGPRPKLAGIVLAKRERRSQRGRYAFVTMSDPSGVYEVGVFSEVFAQAREHLDANVPLLVEVDVREEEESLRLAAARIQVLDEVAAHKLAGYRIFVGDNLAANGLRGVLEREGGGRGRLNLVVPTPEGDEVEIELEGRYAISPAMRAALKSVPGVVDVHDL